MSLSADTVASSLESLATLIPLLQGFTHRNKNQHRLSHWFPSLSRLRRSLRRIQAELLPLQRSHSRKGAAIKDEERLLNTVRWTRRAVIPKCYLKFTQLVADNQHAALGLLLLSVLARVNTLVGVILPDEPAQEVEAAAVAEKLTDKEDMGVAISREDADGAPTSMEGVKTPAQTDQQMVEESGVPEDVRNRALQRIQPETRTGKRQKKKKKEMKKKKGDEFSSLFASLV